MATAPDILIIDDDVSLTEMLALHFDDKHLSSMAVHTGEEAQTFLGSATPRLILLDQHLPDSLGLNLIPWIRERHAHLPIIMMTGMHDTKLAISAIKSGASDYIHKPIDTEQLDSSVQQALAAQSTKVEVKVRAQSAESSEIAGTSRAILEVYKNIAVASQSDTTILVTGESGSGKELVAKAIHNYSEKTGPFLALNCAAIVDTLMESELFGHEKGAFTGAVSRKDGKFTQAQDGTLFLDEIGEMSPNLQAKLLRVLQEGTFERVGGTETLHTNARIITATHRNLPALIETGKFREDLYYRLRVMQIHMPPLRNRKEDIPELTSHLIARINAKLGKHIAGADAETLSFLQTYDWPGNVRELENTLTSAAALAQRDIITKDLIELEPARTHDSTPQPAGSLKSLEDLEKKHVWQVLKTVDGHRGKACEILGISRPALERRIKKYHFDI